MAMDCAYHEDCEVCVCETRYREALEAIRELNERAASHLITMINALQQACLERDQARAALRQSAAELHWLKTKNEAP